MRTLLRIFGFLLTVALWDWVKDQTFPPVWSFAVMIGGTLAVVPASRLGRVALDRRPTAERAAQAAVPVHYTIMMTLGSALIESVKSARVSPRWIIPLPPEVGMVLSAASGVIVALTVVSLALRGLGAPFAIFVSRRLAAGGMYAWTRNPMVLSLLVFLISFGLWTRSGMFAVWVVGLATPVMIYYLKTFEERELEIRFGDSYREYKARTPMLWPRKPRKEPQLPR